MLDKIPSNYAFVVHTDSYAGNFERDMCAFITGVVGECGVGIESIDEKVDYEIVQDIIASYPDEHGCCRPVTICNTSDQWKEEAGKWVCNSVAILLDEKPTLEQKKFMEERAMLFPDFLISESREEWGRYRIKVLGVEWKEIQHTYAEKQLEF